GLDPKWRSHRYPTNVKPPTAAANSNPMPDSLDQSVADFGSSGIHSLLGTGRSIAGRTELVKTFTSDRQVSIPKHRQQGRGGKVERHRDPLRQDLALPVDQLFEGHGGED